MRKILKQILALLTKWAISKHEIEIIAVVGEKHSRLTSYLLWELLRDNYFTRCQWDRSFWDLSIPLTILGYDARQKSISEWIKTIVKALWVLISQKAQSQIIILHIPYTLPEILKYWLGLFKPAKVIAFKGDINKDRFDILKESVEKITVVGRDIKSEWLSKSDITHDLPGIYWEYPILAASYVASMYDISNKDISNTLNNLDPLIFLKVRERIEK